jgi:hypothetical protein
MAKQPQARHGEEDQGARAAAVPQILLDASRVDQAFQPMIYAFSAERLDHESFVFTTSPTHLLISSCLSLPFFTMRIHFLFKLTVIQDCANIRQC